MARITIGILKKKNQVRKDGRCPVRLLYFEGREPKHITIHDDHLCLPEQWNNEEKCFRKNFPNYKVHNQLLEDALQRAQDIIKELNFQNTVYSFEDFMKRFSGIKDTISLDEACQYYYQHFMAKKDKSGVGTATTFDELAKMVRRFRKNVLLKDINGTFLKGLEAWYLAQKNSKGGLASYFRTLRSLLNKAAGDNMYDISLYPFGKNGYSISKLNQKPAPVYIPKKIINQLRSLDLPLSEDMSVLRSNKAFARDIFIFSYICRGMSFADIAKLKDSDIIGNRIVYRRQKSNSPLNIKLNLEALEIIQRYRPFRHGTYIFPIYNDAIHQTDKQRQDRRKTVGKHINRILKSFDIGYPLSMSIARDSFANEAKRAGLSTGVIQNFLGHEDEKTTQIYLMKFSDDELDDLADLVIS